MEHLNNFPQNTKHRFIFNIFNIFYYNYLQMLGKAILLCIKSCKRGNFLVLDMNVSFRSSCIPINSQSKTTSKIFS